MTSRKSLAYAAVALLVSGSLLGCAGYRRHRESMATSSYLPTPPPSGSSQGEMIAMAAAQSRSVAQSGESALEHLPWPTEVYRVNLAVNGPVALTQLYLMKDDVLAVDGTGKVFCLSRRDLSPRWVSSLRSPLAAPIAETPVYYV